MTRHQLEHILRAAGGNADTNDIVVIGSQAILGTYPEAPEELLISVEADVFPMERPEDSILIDGAIGERSIFHETFGYYAHGIDETTAVLPEGWKKRLVPLCNENTRGVTGWCLEVHDLAVSKLAAGREKDLYFVRAMIRKALVKAALISKRLQQTPGLSTEAIDSLQKRIQAWATA